MNSDYVEQYENLSYAIIIQAIKDYKKAKKKLIEHPENKAASETLAETEKFLRSSLCETLSSPEMALLIQEMLTKR
jgi:hypothetical protein